MCAKEYVLQFSGCWEDSVKECSSAWKGVCVCVCVHPTSQFARLSVLSARPMRASLAQQQPAGRRRTRKSEREEQERRRKGRARRRCALGRREFHHSLPDRKARFQLSCLPTSPPPPPPFLPVAACMPPALDTKAFSALAFNSVKIMGDSLAPCKQLCSY